MLQRRGLLGLFAGLVAAPALVQADALMRVRPWRTIEPWRTIDSIAMPRRWHDVVCQEADGTDAWPVAVVPPPAPTAAPWNGTVDVAWPSIHQRRGAGPLVVGDAVAEPRYGRIVTEASFSMRGDFPLQPGDTVQIDGRRFRVTSITERPGVSG